MRNLQIVTKTGRMWLPHSTHTWLAVVTKKQLRQKSFWSKPVTLVKNSAQHEKQKTENRAMFRRVLLEVRFLAQQGLSLRGHGEGTDSNFTQLLHLWAFNAPAVLTWMEKKTDRYMSSDIQNECLEIMALSILW